MRLRFGTGLLAAGVALAIAAPSYAGLITSFESGLGNFATVAAGTTLSVGPVGATDGVNALAIHATVPGWFNQAQDTTTSSLAQLHGNSILKADVTLLPAEMIGATFAQVVFVIQGDGLAWTQSDSAVFTDTVKDVPIDGLPHTVSWNYSSVTIPTNPSWWNFILVTNTDATDATFHIDNVRTSAAAAVPEPASLGLLGLGALALLRRRK